MAVNARPVVGMRDVVYAVLSEPSDIVGGTPLYGAVKKLAGSGKISINPNASAGVLYGDDLPLHVADSIGKIDVAVDFADLDPAAEAELLGHRYINGGIVKNADDQSPYVALGFRTTHTGAGVSTLCWLYKGKFIKPDASTETRKESVNFQAKAMKAVFVPLLSSGDWQIKVRTDDPAAPAALVGGFFDNVVLTPTADLGALSCSIAADGTKLAFTFSKVGGGNVTILTDSLIAGATALVSKGGAIVAGTGVWTGQGTAAAVWTFAPTVAFGSGDVLAAVTREVRDANCVACAPKTAIVTYA